MPRQRRRRRQSQGEGSRSRAEAAAAPADDAFDDSVDKTNETARPKRSRARLAWWLPTAGILTAFCAGLWLGGTLSLTETASAVALIVGAVGTGAGLARLVRRDLIRRRKLQTEVNRARAVERANEERQRVMRERVS